MTAHLREELDRLADSAPRIDVDPSTWDRGRAVRRRDRALLVAAVLTLVASLGGLGALATRPASLGPADGDVVPGGAIPSIIRGEVPEGLIEGPDSQHGEVSWSGDRGETTLAVGRASAAFAAGRSGSLPVVVTAADGVHHLLELPGWLGAGTINATSGPVGLALSPDGGHLAYAWWDPAAPLDRPMPAGIRVLDLLTGDVRAVPLEGGNGVRVRSIAWSPDSRWLAWSGEELTSWTPHSSGGSRLVAGRIAPGASVSEAVPVARAELVAVSVTSAGEVVVVRQGGMTVVWDGDVLSRREGVGLDTVLTGSVSPDGTSVAVGSWRPDTHLSFVAPTTGRVTRRELAKDLDRYPHGAAVRPLGWADERLVMALVAPGEGGGEIAARPSELVVMTAPSRPSSEWTYRVVGSVEGDWHTLAPSLSVAVDLVPALDGTAHQRLTHDFGEPAWSGSPQRRMWIGGAIAVALLAGLVLLMSTRRRLMVHGAATR